MAGDLLIIDIDYHQKQCLIDAGARAEQTIYHSNRAWSAEQLRLSEQIARQAGPQERRQLPAHAYIRFDASSRDAVQGYCQDRDARQRLADVLGRCTRPLGVVSGNPHLRDWGDTDPVAHLTSALQHGAVVIEYYKQDHSPLMTAFGNDPQWTRVPE